MQDHYPYYIAGVPEAPNHDLPVTDKFSGEVAARVALADERAIDRAIAAAVDAAEPMRRMRPYERQAALQHCVSRFEATREELAQVLCLEAGKPIRDSRGEVARLIDTFRVAAEEAVRLGGEVMNLEISSRAEGYQGRYRRFPIGPCSFISPFNFPLNLVAHKVAPALAVGCPFVLKPASMTPIGALMIGEVLAQLDLPRGAFSILPCRRGGAALFTTDERLRLLSFTGSPDVGWELKSKAGKKRVLLELGGNAAVIVDRDADLDDASDRILVGAFSQSGQSCISVQRILIHAEVYDALRARLVAGARGLTCGDPKDEATVVGPLITEKEARRVEAWVERAVAAGGTLLCGGGRSGSMMEPTLLEGVPTDEPICAEEAFGPVAVLSPFDDFDAALRTVNESRFGLQAGVFTRDLYRAERAFEELEVGGVVIGDVPSWRVDNMPYGGVKDSGFGREGVRFSMEEMTELRLLVTRTPRV